MKKIVLSLALVAMLSLVGCSALNKSAAPATDANKASDTTVVVPEKAPVAPVTPDAKAPVTPAK